MAECWGDLKVARSVVYSVARLAEKSVADSAGLWIVVSAASLVAGLGIR